MNLAKILRDLVISGALALDTASSARADLVAHWKFEEGSGNIAYDSSGYGNHGTIFGEANYIEGKEGLGLSFDGIDDYVRVPYSQSIGELPEVTLEAWIKRNSNSDGMIISKNGPYYLSVRGDKVEGGILAGTPPTWQEVRGTTSLEMDRWYKVSMTYDKSFVKVYLGWVEDGSVPKVGDIYVTSQNLHIGWGQPGHNQFFNGVIDEAKVHNTAIPEPSTLGLLACAGLLAVGRRK